jgi:hypothetical protein
MVRFQTVLKSTRFVYTPYTATEMQGFAQVLADSTRARILSGGTSTSKQPHRSRPDCQAACYPAIGRQKTPVGVITSKSQKSPRSKTDTDKQSVIISHISL